MARGYSQSQVRQWRSLAVAKKEWCELAGNWSRRQWSIRQIRSGTEVVEDAQGHQKSMSQSARCRGGNRWAKVLGSRQEGWSVNGPIYAGGVVVAVVEVVAVIALGKTQLRHPLPRPDMRALIHAGRAPIALSIQWWGLRRCRCTWVGGLAGESAGQGGRRSGNRQSTYYVRMGALRCVAFARRVTAARVEESWTGAVVAGTTALFSSWVGTAPSAERHQ